MQYSEFKQRVIDRVDILDLIEILDITVEDILDHFEEEIMEEYETLAKTLEIEDPETEAEEGEV